MKKSALLLLVLFVASLTAAGCAKKTATEQLKADMNKAADQMKKEMNNL
jgi:outer membrane lipoprotein-sorting protein